MRSHFLPALLFVVFACRIQADTETSGDTQLLGKLSWDESLWRDASPAPSTPRLQTQPDGETVLQISVGKNHLPLLTIPDELIQKITQPSYAILGEVRCEHVETGCYLTLQNDFSSVTPEQPKVHKLVQDTGAGGPMGALIGTQDWREFWLPINTDNVFSGAKVSHLQVELWGTGPGTVYLRKLRLVQYLGPTQDFLIHQNQIYVHEDWMGALTYSTDNKTFTDLAPIRRLLKTCQQTHPQDGVSIIHPRSVTDAKLAPLTQIVKDTGFLPMYGETPEGSLFAGTKWVVVVLLLLLITAGTGIYFFIHKTHRRRRELRRIASMDG